MNGKVVRGSSFDELFAKEPGRFPNRETRFDREIGFRLAYDSADRVNRGGSWLSTPGFARAASRRWSSPGGRFDFLGFRLVRDGT